MKSIIRKIALSFVSPLSQLQLTSEFNEVYFSERRNFEATHKIPTSKNKFGWRNLQGFGTVKFLLKSFPIRSVGKLRPQSYDAGAHRCPIERANAIHQEQELRGSFPL